MVHPWVTHNSPVFAYFSILGQISMHKTDKLITYSTAVYNRSSITLILADICAYSI
ncbi:hypothetical protein BDW66DRAFT_140844 [Aspergillus desertorum]